MNRKANMHLQLTVAVLLSVLVRTLILFQLSPKELTGSSVVFMLFNSLIPIGILWLGAKTLTRYKESSVTFGTLTSALMCIVEWGDQTRDIPQMWSVFLGSYISYAVLFASIYRLVNGLSTFFYRNDYSNEHGSSL